jgi:hypothetical protein
MVVPGQPGQKVCQTPHIKKKSWAFGTCHSSNTKHKKIWIMDQAGLGKKVRLYLQNKQSKKNWRFGKHEALSLSLNTF